MVRKSLPPGAFSFGKGADSGSSQPSQASNPFAMQAADI